MFDLFECDMPYVHNIELSIVYNIINREVCLIIRSYVKITLVIINGLRYQL